MSKIDGDNPGLFLLDATLGDSRNRAYFLADARRSGRDTDRANRHGDEAEELPATAPVFAVDAACQPVFLRVKPFDVVIEAINGLKAAAVPVRTLKQHQEVVAAYMPEEIARWFADRA